MKIFTVVVLVVLLTVRVGAQQPSSGKPATATAGSASRVLADLEVLSDTQGIDFGPYLSKIVQAVRKNWYAVLPAKAGPPDFKSGTVSMQFNILRDGHVDGMKLTHLSGDVGMDRAALGGITASAPFAPLPEQYTGPFLTVTFTFHYNPKKAVAENPTKKAPH